jgi:hypothetical protein
MLHEGGHTTTEEAAPGIIDRSMNRFAEGLVREHRELVLPAGATIRIRRRQP